MQGFKLNQTAINRKSNYLILHPNTLKEQTNREGFIESDESRALITILQWIIDIEFRNFINKIDNETKEKFNFEKFTEKYRDTCLNELYNFTQLVEKEFGDEKLDTINSMKLISNKITKEFVFLTKEVKKIQDQSAEDYDKFVYLAGIGLLTEFIFHELDRIVSYTINMIKNGKKSNISIDVIIDQLDTLQKRISVFDDIASVKRQVKSTFDLANLIDTIINNHDGEFSRHNIKIVRNFPNNTLKIKAVRGMIVQIIENLIINATFWIKRQNFYEVKNLTPTIEFIVDNDNRTLYIRDNGPGFPVSQKEWIFEPFVTSKPVGLGRGLGLYISRDLAKYHGWSLYADDNYSLNEGRLNGFVLDMS